jgi:hypothetical protein
MRVQINELLLTSGESVPLKEGVTLIVGPNNSGKSALLRETHALICAQLGQQPVCRVVKQVDMSFLCSAEEAIQDLKTVLPYREPGQGETMGHAEPVFLLPGSQALAVSTIRQLWSSNTGLGPLGQVHSLLFTAEQRTGMAHPAQAFNSLTEAPQQPLQMLWLNRTLEARLSAAVKAAFGEPITVNRYAGQQISLHVGTPLTPESIPPPGQQYLRELATLPQAYEQGDGMKSFIGILMTVIAGNHQLLLVDEPEAFLHPPQARLLGRLLSEMCQQGVRVVVATHSIDIIQGITSTSERATPVAIHRLTRRGLDNHVATIDRDSVKTLYTDPLLRHSSILDGLFYHGVVVCESEGDCTYYGAVNSEAATGGALDLHFTHASGKSRIGRAVAALKSAKVPVATIVDIDILQDDFEFNRLLASHGIDAAPYTGQLKVIQDAVKGKGQTVQRAKVRDAISAIFQGGPTDLSKEEILLVRTAVQAKSGWKLFKTSGVALFSGHPRAVAEQLMTDLQASGVFLVPCGELEGFHPAVIATDKLKWLQEVLESELYLASGDHTRFVSRVRQYIAGQQ